MKKKKMIVGFESEPFVEVLTHTLQILVLTSKRWHALVLARALAEYS